MPIIALVGCSLFAVSIPPVPDHGYQFYLAARILDGARLYVDVAAADSHPPLFTWLAMAVEAAARRFGASGLGAYLFLVCAAIAASIHAVWRIGLRSAELVTVLLVALFPVAGHFFGQGEHLALVLSLPYLTAAAIGPFPAPGSRVARVAVAAAAAFGLAMKPHFALVWVGAELYLARRHGVRSLLRIESVTIGALFVLYVAATAILAPEFFRILPWVMRLYPAFAAVAVWEILLDWRTLLLISGLVASRAVTRTSPLAELADLLAIGAVAMFLTMLFQGKGWGYHWYPVNALSVVLLGFAFFSRQSRSPVVAPLLAAASVLWMSSQPERTARLLVSAQSYLPDMMEITERYAGEGDAIVAFCHALNVGFPLVNLTGTQWASPYGHLWMVPALYADAWNGRKRSAYRDSGRWRQLEQEMFDRLWRQIERDDPAVTIVRLRLANGFDFREFFETDPRFRARFRASPVLDTIGDYVVLGRPADSAVGERRATEQVRQGTDPRRPG